MPEFFNVLPPQAALETLLNALPPVRPEVVEVDVLQALGQVNARDLHAKENLPSFPRSIMDGYSLRAADTYGATEGLPAYFTVAGEVPMGRPAEVSVGLGEAAIAYTGGMLANGADAVVMVEHTQPVDATTIEVVRPVAPGENVVQPGEDVQIGAAILPRGHLIRPPGPGGTDRPGHHAGGRNPPPPGGHPVHGRRGGGARQNAPTRPDPGH